MFYISRLTSEGAYIVDTVDGTEEYCSVNQLESLISRGISVLGMKDGNIFLPDSKLILRHYLNCLEENVIMRLEPEGSGFNGIQDILWYMVKEYMNLVYCNAEVRGLTVAHGFLLHGSFVRVLRGAGGLYREFVGVSGVTFERCGVATLHAISGATLDVPLADFFGERARAKDYVAYVNLFGKDIRSIYTLVSFPYNRLHVSACFSNYTRSQYASDCSKYINGVLNA